MPSEKEPETITADFARQWWKSLMANTVALVEDAALLASHDSPGRAQALIVLAMEELAKARWLYDAAEHECTAPLGLYGLEPRAARDVVVPEGLTSVVRGERVGCGDARDGAGGLARWPRSAARTHALHGRSSSAWVANAAHYIPHRRVSPVARPARALRARSCAGG